MRRKPDSERKTQRVPVMLSPVELQELDDMRFATRSPSRNEAIRHLLRKGLDAIAPKIRKR